MGARQIRATSCRGFPGGERGVGVLSRNLEKSLHRALAYANERRHEYATLEHLLLSLTEDQDAIASPLARSAGLPRSDLHRRGAPIVREVGEK